ncbi:hypothetical protein SRHO_G00081290 [Serrasalmus rhombeus]
MSRTRPWTHLLQETHRPGREGGKREEDWKMSDIPSSLVAPWPWGSACKLGGMTARQKEDEEREEAKRPK